MEQSSDDFDPTKNRLRLMRQAATLACLRTAAAFEAANRLVASAQAEPDPARIHVGVLRRNFPRLHFLHRGWSAGLPDLRDLANLATLRAHFGGKKQSAPVGRIEPSVDEGVAELTRHFRQR